MIINYIQCKEICTKEKTLPYAYRVMAKNVWIPFPSEWKEVEIFNEMERQMRYTNFFEVQIMIGKTKRVFNVIKDTNQKPMTPENQTNNSLDKNWNKKYEEVVNIYIANKTLTLELEYLNKQIENYKKDIAELEKENSELLDVINEYENKEEENKNVAGIKDETIFEKILNFQIIQNILKSEQLANKIGGYISTILPEVAPKNPNENTTQGQRQADTTI